MPFALPLSDDDFRRAVHDGRGRAVLHIRGGHPVTAFHKSVLVDACVNCSTFDPQCEDDRALWVWSLCQASGIVEDAGRAVIERPAILDSDSMDTWDAHHQASILRLAAQSGVPQAREALYALFDRSPQDEGWVARSDILMLDGLAGLLHLARHFGNAIVRENHAFLIEETFSRAVEAHGRNAVMTCLEAAATSEPEIAVFLATVSQDDIDPTDSSSERRASWRPGPEDLATATYEQMLEGIQGPNGPVRVSSFVWGRHAPISELEGVFEMLDKETDSARLLNLVKVFYHRPAPRFHPVFLELIDSPNYRLANASRHALSFVRDPSVRAAGLERLARDVVDENTITLLHSNLEPGDEPRILAALRPAEDRNDLHRQCWWLVGKEKGRPHWPASLVIWGYEHTPCELCRNDAVRHLLERNEAPRWLLEEACEDSDEQTREQARAALQEHASG